MVQLRGAILATLAVLLVGASHADYAARLYFKNESTGASNAGGVPANVGDTISVNFSFHGGVTGVNRWSALQATLDLYANTVVRTQDANTWNAGIRSVFTRPPCSGRYVWQPSDGLLRDNATDPGDPRSVVVTPAGVTLFVSIDRSKPGAKDIDVKLFRFVADTNGSLDWRFKGRETPTGLSTRLIDMSGKTASVADNWLAVSNTSPVMINGQVLLDRLSPTAPQPNLVTMRITRDGDTPSFQTVGLDPSGNFALSLAPGNYQLSVQFGHWLRRTVSVTASLTNASHPSLFLLNGDCVRDGVVGILDINLALADYGNLGNDPADLDEDGLVGLADITILTSNFLEVGDP